MTVLVCVVGDKGGIGKSTWARGLSDVCRRRAIRAALFDGDWISRSLFKVFCARGPDGGVIPLSRQDPRTGCVLYDAHHKRLGRDLLLNSLAVPNVDIVLHDLPAGFRGIFTNLMGIQQAERALQEFVASCRSLSVTPVFAIVITPHWAGHQGATWLAEAVGSAATVVAVRNELYGDELFGLWRAGEQERFARLGGIEIAMPGMDNDAYLLCDTHGVRYGEADALDGLSLADKLRVKSWVRRFEVELARLEHCLPIGGLPPDASADDGTPSLGVATA